MKTKTIITLSLSALLIPFVLQAKPGGEGKRSKHGDILERLDTDNSGGISFDEAKGPIAENFDLIDTDNSGELTKDELREAKNKRKKGQRLKEIDTDESGSVSLEEANAANATKLIENFDAIDSNNDGELSKEEMKAAHKSRRDQE